jgi:hypothetical protein
MTACQYCELDDRSCPGRGLCHCGCAGDPCKYLQGHRHSKPHLKTPPLSMAELKAMGG